MNPTFACCLVFSFCFTHAFGQEKEFFDEAGTKATEDRAAYYQLAKRNSRGQLSGQVREYYLNGGIRREVRYRKGKKEGRDVYYYPNGKIKSESNYTDGKEVGAWQLWYPNGQAKTKGTMVAKATISGLSRLNNVTRVESYWDSTGRQLVENGNGTYVNTHENGTISSKGAYVDGYEQGEWTEYYPDGTLHYLEQYDNGEVTDGILYRRDGTQTHYNQFEVMPEFQGGINGLMDYLSSKVKYPSKALKMGRQGTVYVGFVIDREGNVGEVNALKGIDQECDAEAVRVVRIMPPWTPGLQRGEPVPVKYTLPIRFTIN